MSAPRRALVLIGTSAVLACAVQPALAQAHNPFSVGISEGGGSASGVTGWILAQQAWFEHQLSAAVRAAKADGSAFWTLVGLSFAYGVFHAAGPGHGKAVLASYMVANERALRRGIVLSLLAAVLQGLVAIVLVGVCALMLHATAQRMKDAASLVEVAGFAGIAALGAWLVWRKGRTFFAVVRSRRLAVDPALALFGPVSRFSGEGRGLALAGFATPAAVSRFACAPGDADHPLDCGHCHGPDPATLAGPAFSWREAVMTIAAAGFRPCSGAILVLVFALTQGLFAAGIAAVLAMSLGVALTTAALASLAVLAKGLARRVASPGSHAGRLLIAGLELVAAALVLSVGTALLLGYAVGSA